MREVRTTAPARERSTRIPELDGLRAFAVGLMILNHMTYFSRSLPWAAGGLGVLISHAGPVGVSLFFVISGFIITTLLQDEKSATGRISLRGFYLRRICRIVPPLVVYFGVLLVLGALGAITVAPRPLLWGALFLADTELVDTGAWFVAHTWTLSVEEQFYLLFPPLLTFRLRTRATLLALGAAYALSLASLKLAHELSVHVAPGWINFAGFYSFRYIIVGVALTMHGRSVIGFLADKSRLLPVGLAMAILAFRLVPSSASRWSVLAAALEPACCGLFVFWFVQNPGRCTPLRWPVVQWLGLCSYSIYLWQQLFTGPAAYYHGWNVERPLWAGSGILLCAALSRYLVERPFIRLGQLLSRPSTTLSSPKRTRSEITAA